MKRFLFSILCFLSVLSEGFVEELYPLNPLKERLKKAKNGDFIVTEANKMLSLLAIRSISSQSLILEEISVPLSGLTPKPSSWSEWIRARAPGHTSWSMMELDLNNTQLIECYSFSRATWIQVPERENLISTLLKLPFHPIPTDKQRRIGPTPSNGEPDLRSLWKPPFIFEGSPRQNHEFEVYSASWPQDGSELSGNQVCLYFDRSQCTPFPVWMQIDTNHLGIPLRVVDSGRGLPEIYRSLPRRVPQFVNHPQKTSYGMKFLLKSPKYYRNFDLFVVDVTTREREICPITYSLVQGEGELLHIEIAQEELQQTLKANHRYTWLIVPTGHSEYYSESLKPFLWRGEE